ncbi:MAG TPA: HDOD domain-containing protein [Dissulfurispiraceae bacterium]|nr:HDOD domain-containing protein [Dissulfurispiraceae bacterium]
MQQWNIDNEKGIRNAEEIILQVGIPPLPKALIDIQNELAKAGPDFRRISDSVSKDVALSAAVLKIANSPFFGGIKTDSIHHALNILGLRNFYSLVMTSSLFNAIGYGLNQSLDKFRRHSSTVAAVCSHIALKLKIDLEEEAYAVGLFHDCGIPLLMKKYADYAQMAEYAMPSSPLETIPDNFESVIGFETSRYHTNHCIMSLMLAKSWGMSDKILAVILTHHDISMYALKSPGQRHLAAILFVSEFICQDCDTETYSFHQDAAEWLKQHKNTLDEIQLKPADVGILRDEACEIIKSNEWF